MKFEPAVQGKFEELLSRIAGISPIRASQLSGERPERNDIGRGDKPDIRDLLAECFADLKRQIRTVQEVAQVL